MPSAVHDPLYQSPRRSMTRLSFCITCMGRLHHLRRTLVANLQSTAHLPEVEFVLLNYSSPDGLDAWAQTELRPFIAAGRLNYYHAHGFSHFHMAHAKNIAHRIAAGEIVCNLDADNFLGTDFAEFLFDAFANGNCIFVRAPFAANTCGRIAFRKADFVALGGYDERLKIGWGYDDRDIIIRATAFGLKETIIPADKDFLRAVPHSNEDRTRFMREKNRAVSDAENTRLSNEALGAGCIVANAGKAWGSAVLKKNFVNPGEGSSNEKSGAAGALLPTKLHFVWLGSALPACFEDLIAQAKRLHPGWTVKLWGEAETAALIGRMATGLDQVFASTGISHSTRSDIARYHIVAAEGGFYLDTDFLLFKSFDPLRVHSFVGAEQKNGLIATSCFGAAAGHSIFRRIFERLRLTDFSKPPDVSAGPGMFDKVCRKWLPVDANTRILRPASFFPVDYTVKHHLYRWETADLKECFGAHLWAHSWAKDGGDGVKDLRARVEALRRNLAVQKLPATKVPEMVLSPAQRLHLEIYGYVVVPSLISPEQADALRGALLEARAAALKNRDAAHGPAVGKSSRLPHLLHLRRIVEKVPHVLEYVTQPRIVAAAEEALGSEARIVEIYAIINSRSPSGDGGGVLSFHRGANPVTGGFVREGLYYGNFVKTLTYLTDVGPEDGGTVVIAGSHKLDLPMDRLVEASRKLPGLVHHVVANKGDTLIQFESVIHATGRIKSASERVVMVCGYAASFYPWWDVAPLSSDFLKKLAPGHRTLFFGRAHWEQPERKYRWPG